jgi:hypothetical protein
MGGENFKFKKRLIPEYGSGNNLQAKNTSNQTLRHSIFSNGSAAILLEYKLLIFCFLSLNNEVLT